MDTELLMEQQVNVEGKPFVKWALNLELSGIANISFEGYQGYSTPTSEIFWWNKAIRL